MFFRNKPTITETDIAWQLDAWRWLLENLGGVEQLREFPTLIPSEIDFPPSGKKELEHANFVFEQVSKRFKVDESSFELILQEETFDPNLGDALILENAPLDPLGTYKKDTQSQKHHVTFSPDLLKNLEHLIATFSHEICHSILFSIPTPPPGEVEENDFGIDVIEELATELATVYFGFGIFNGNASMSIEQFTNNATGMQGWRGIGGGYFSQSVWSFALAVRAHLTQEDRSKVLNYSKASIIIGFKKNFKYLEKNADLIDDLLKIK